MRILSWISGENQRKSVYARPKSFLWQHAVLFGTITSVYSKLAYYLLILEEWLKSVGEKIKLNPLYAIPYVFLIAVMLFAIILGFGVFVLGQDGSPP